MTLGPRSTGGPRASRMAVHRVARIHLTWIHGDGDSEDLRPRPSRQDPGQFFRIRWSQDSDAVESSMASGPKSPSEIEPKKLASLDME